MISICIRIPMSDAGSQPSPTLIEMLGGRWRFRSVLGKLACGGVPARAGAAGCRPVRGAMLRTQSIRHRETTASAELARFIAGSIEAAVAADDPFQHLVINHVFRMTSTRACSTACRARHYRPMHGRSKGHDLADGTHTRVKIDLFPEYVRHLPDERQAVWRMVGEALCSDRPKDCADAPAGKQPQTAVRRPLRGGRHVSHPGADA